MARAAALVGSWTRPLVLCGTVDLEGAFTAVGLAQRLGAVLDFSSSADLRPFQERGHLGTTPGEARLRADMVLLVGEMPTDGRARAVVNHLLPADAEMSDAHGRRIIAVHAGMTAPIRSHGTNRPGLSGPPSEAAVTLGLLRARNAGRPAACPKTRSVEIDAVLDELRAARYGIALFDPATLDPLAIEQLLGLVDELSAETRWSVLPLPAPAGHAELMRASLARTGMPPPLGFGPGGSGMYDPWRFSGRRALLSGEVDGVIWLECGEEDLPAWLPAEVPLVAFCAEAAPPCGIAVEVARPGRDAPGTVEDPRSGTLRPLPATVPSARPSLAAALQALEAALARSRQAAA